MKMPKKVKKAIVKKLRNLKDIAAPKETATQGLSVSNGRELSAGPEKPLGDVPNVETTIEQQTLSPTATTDAAINVESTIAESCDNSNITTTEDQNIADKIEKTQELNTSDILPLAEIKPCFYNSAANEQEKPLQKATQQRRATVAGIVGVALLANSIALYILKMHVIAVTGGIIGLVCMGFALYNAIKPSTKLEKIEDMEQPVTAYPPLNRA